MSKLYYISLRKSSGPILIASIKKILYSFINQLPLWTMKILINQNIELIIMDSCGYRHFPNRASISSLIFFDFMAIGSAEI